VLSPVSDATLEGSFLRRQLHRAGIRGHRTVTVTGFDGDRVTGEREFGDPWSLAASGLVLVTQQSSDDTLYRELTADPEALQRNGIRGVYRIGDAVAPRLLSEAVFDGHRLARELDRPDPAVPLPYLRELAAVAPQTSSTAQVDG